MKPVFPTKNILLFIVFTAVLSLIGYYYYQDRKEIIKSEKYNELTAITELKINQISGWRQERINDGKTILYNSIIDDQITEFITKPSNSIMERKIKSWFESLKDLYDYNDVLLVDKEGRALIRINESNENIQSIPKDLLLRSKNEGVIFDYLNQDINGNIHIDLIIPFINNDNFVGSIIAQIDPHKFLYPLIQSWPTPSKTSESLIIRRDDNDILFLNELRHRKNTALKLRIPITQEDLPAAKAALGIEGIVEGKDYRQVDVLASVNKIPGSPWFMVTKVDADEIFEPIQTFAHQIILLTILLIITVTGVIISIWRHQKSIQYKRQYQLEAEKNALSKHYEFLTKYANDVILLTDSNGKIVEANERAVSFYGYSHDELKELSISEIRLHSDKKNIKITSEEKIIENGETYESIHIRKDGRTIPVEVSARYISIDDKKFRQEIIRDISERKEANKKLSHSNRLYAILSQVNQTILHSNKKQFLMDEVCRVVIEFGKFGFALIGLNNKKSGQIKLAAHKGVSNGFAESLIDMTNNSNGFDPIHKAMETDNYVVINDIKLLEGNDKLKLESEKRGFKSFIAVPLHTNKKIVGVLSIYSHENNFFDTVEKNLVDEIASDISYALEKFEIEKNQRKIEKRIRENERRLSTLLDNLPGTAYRCKNNENWTMEFISAGCQELTGYQPDEIIGDKIIAFNDLIHPEDRQKVYDVVDKSIHKCKSFTIEYRILTKDGKLKWVWEKGTGICDNNGNVETLEGFINDITQKKKAEKELVVSKEKAESANKMKSEFLAQVSHEIRTPINTITNFCSFLEETFKDAQNEESIEGFNIINLAGKRIIRTIDLILNMSEIQTGSYEPLFKKLDINKLLRNLLLEFRSQAEYKGLEINIKNLKEHCFVQADEYSISQVFANLIDNAIKYTQKGNIEIDISNSEKKNVLVSVKDTGIGISDDYLPVLFNPFSQEERGYTRRFEGNGLGLALVKNYCDINKAEISVVSQKGKGTKFTIKFPENNTH